MHFLLLFLSHVIYSTLIDWLIFKFPYYMAHSEIMLAASADQLLYNLSLIKLCSECALKNTSYACLLLAK